MTRRPPFATGTIDVNEFVLAEMLHKTVYELRQLMPAYEYPQWLGFLRGRESRTKQQEAKRDAADEVRKKL